MSIIEMKVPTIGESITEVTLSTWLKENGTYVNLDDPICEFESDKATLEFPAEASGKLIWVAREGDDLEIGALVAKIDTSVDKELEKPKEEAPVKVSSTKNEERTDKPDSNDKGQLAKGHPAPAAGKILREKGISPEDVEGTGKGGRILKADALKAQPKEVSKQPLHKESLQESFSRNTRREKLSRMRRTIARRLVSAKNNTAMLTTFNEADMSEIISLRKKYQERFVEKHGVKLGFMSIFAKACSNVLMEMPQVNSILDGEELIYHEYVDLSIAISTPNGLVVPPIKNVESLNFHEIELKIKELAEKAREGKLSLDEMTGGTFTITNGGIFGSMMSTPILNEPQSAILGMHNIVPRAVVIEGKVVVRPMMYLALSYDHRVIDGSTSVTFLVKVKEQLEDPVKLLMDL